MISFFLYGFLNQKGINIIKVLSFFVFILHPLVVRGQVATTRNQDSTTLAPYISRTLNLLNSSTPENPVQVRILVYGQSISEQDWWKIVKDFIEDQYPHANILMTNKAVGGFSTNRLKLMAKNDVLSLYPDLIFLHDYGNDEDYEKIIRTIRNKTTSEIILQTDHVAVGQGQEWHDEHSSVTLPFLAQKYGLAIVDIRSAWKKHLQQNNLNPSDLLIDQVHLNEKGNSLMANIIISHLKALSQHTTIDKNEIPQVIKTDLKDIVLHRLTLAGNRVDLVWKENITGNTQPISITIDGKLPSEVPGCYFYTRPIKKGSTTFLSNIGQLLAVKLGENIEEEAWSLSIMEVDSINQQFLFSVKGSKTGDDGMGSSAKTFTSNSGKISIEPESWFRRNDPGDFAHFTWLNKSDELKWNVKFMCKDSIEPQSRSIDTVVQGVANKKHELSISGEGLKNLKEIRVYQPPLDVTSK